MVNREGLSEHLRSHAHQGGLIVCEELKFLYMKPTKTAGTSILRAGLEKRIPGIIHLKDHPEKFQEWSTRITDEQLDDYFIFAVVRNPWDRLVSVATYFDLHFSDFINNLEDYWKNDNIRVHSLPLHTYTHCNGVQFADVVCRFEHLQLDMNRVFDHINLEREPLAFVNNSIHKHYSSYYSSADIKIVETIYKKDIQYFGYTFDRHFAREEGFISGLKQHFARVTKRKV